MPSQRTIGNRRGDRHTPANTLAGRLKGGHRDLLQVETSKEGLPQAEGEPAWGVPPGHLRTWVQAIWMGTPK